MAWIPKEIEALLAADGKRRYEYFIHRVCATRKVWGLYADGWASLGDDDEKQKLILFWPHEVFATRFRTEAWQAYVPKAIELDAFLTRWIPGMKLEGVGPAIFPVGSGSAVLVTLEDLDANLRHELSEVHGEDV